MSEHEMKKVETLPDFIQLEHQILEFWEEHQIFNKLREKNADGDVFRFLDGPVTANNPMGVHHARGRTLKDTFLRYKSLHGYTSHYQNGFDGQGLWVEVEVEKELGFKGKEDILEYGIEEFIKRCKERVEKYSAIQTEQSIRLGQWMDWPNSYYTHRDENIEGIWYFLNKCHQNGWLYKSHRPMRWCPRCGTSLSEHEMLGSYRDVVHMSVYALTPAKNEEFSFLVWTTTPWTLPGNTALAVNPELDYVIVKVAGWESPIVLVSTQLGVLRSKDIEVLRTVKGTELVGIEYETFFPDLPIQSDVNHRVISWDDVDAATGTGIVHIAPACGIEDFQLSEVTDIVVLPIVDEAGKYLSEVGDLAGKGTDNVANIIFDKLDNQSKLYRSEEFEHSYPICWRCKTETIFRLVNDWNINTDEIRPRLLEAAESVVWQPDYAGKVMSDWLKNMGDWSISRKRFYGLPLPIYPCDECGEITVVGSKVELSQLSGVSVTDLPELHRPYIDEITIKCPNCDATHVQRIPEVGDVWLDAGIVPYTTLGYFDNKAEWEKYFPAEWITEMREQIRLWFYSMLFMSVTISGRAPYEKVSVYESVLSETGTKFSKTGFMIRFDEAAEEIGVDVMRYLYMSTRNSSNVLFGYNLADEVRRKILQLWNTYNFYITYAIIDQPDIDGHTIQYDDLLPIDQWMLARIQQFVQESELAYESYDTVGVTSVFEQYLEDLSNGYVRFNRRRIWKSEDDNDKLNCYAIMYKAIVVALRVMSPIMPFITDTIWQNLVRPLKSQSSASVHLSGWPSIEKKLMNAQLLENFSVTRRVISLAQQLREKFSLKTRQPLKTLFITDAPGVQQAILLFGSIIMSETNVHEIEIIKDRTELEVPYLLLNLSKAGPVLRGSTRQIMDILDDLPSDEMAKSVAMFNEGDENIIIQGYDVPLPSDVFIKKYTSKDNIVLASDDDISVGLDNDLTDDLIYEGLVRDLVRHIQVFRKDSNLEVDDRIQLGLETTSETLQKAINVYRDYIQQETLAVDMSLTSQPSNHVKTMAMDEHDITISIAVNKD